jgi:hypothetical protein
VLAGIGGQVEEFHGVVLEPLDQLPVAGADAAAGAAAGALIITILREAGVTVNEA